MTTMETKKKRRIRTRRRKKKRRIIGYGDTFTGYNIGYSYTK